MGFFQSNIDEKLLIEALSQASFRRDSILSINVDVGLGKTDAAIKAIPQLKQMADKSLAKIEQSFLTVTDTSVIEMLAADKNKLMQLKRIVFAVPQHRLGDEIVPRCKEVGLNAAVFRGRLAENPNAHGQCMCLKPDEVQKVTEIGLSVSQTMCINKKMGAECDLFYSCPYQLQIDIVGGADVAVVPHASLFHEMPSIGDRGMLIIDETFIFSGLRGMADTGNPLILSLEELCLDTDKVFHKGKVSTDRTEELHQARLLAANTIERHPIGHIERSRFQDEEWPKVIQNVISYEWGTALRNSIWPGMPKNRFWSIVKTVKGTPGRQKRVLFWRAFHALVSHNNIEQSGWLIRTEDEDEKPAVEIRLRENIKRDWCGGSIVTLDATQSAELTKHFFPNRKMLTEPAITTKMDHVRVLQTVDKSFSASTVIPNDGLAVKEQKRRTNRAREVWRWINLRAIQYRGLGVGTIDVLVICQLKFEKILTEWGLPENIETAHFNALRGLDRWGGVRCVIVIGRTVPPPAVVEGIAETITGSAVDRSVGESETEWWYPKNVVGINVGNDQGWPVNMDRHPDRVAEAVRKQICDAELVQAIGRGRGVNRTWENTLQIDILTNVCLPLVVHEPVRWSEIAPGKIDEMICMGLLPGSYMAAALIYPDIWGSEDAARKSGHKPKTEKLHAPAKTGQIPYIYSIWSLSGFSTGPTKRMALAHATISRPKKRALRFDFLFDEHLIPNPGSWLTDRISMNVEVQHLGPKRWSYSVEEWNSEPEVSFIETLELSAQRLPLSLNNFHHTSADPEFC